MLYYKVFSIAGFYMGCFVLGLVLGLYGIFVIVSALLVSYCIETMKKEVRT